MSFQIQNDGFHHENFMYVAQIQRRMYPRGVLMHLPTPTTQI
jgi:hypothetical protein